MGIYDWSKTAASNTTLESISVAVGAMPPSNVGPLFRALAAALKKWQEDTGGGPTTTGSADAYVLDVNSNPYSGAATFADGDSFSFVANFTNAGASTLNVESEGAKAIRKITSAGDVALAAGDIKAEGHYVVQYDASANSAAGAWILINPLSASPILESLLTTRGDLIRRGASAAERVALGTSTQVLRSDGTDAIWGWPLETWTIACSDETTAVTAANGKATIFFPYAVAVVGVSAGLTTAQSSGNIFTVDIKESTVSILSTLITIDNTETTTNTAAAAAVVSDAAIAAFAPVRFDVTQIGDATAKGLKVYMIVRRSA